MSQGRSKYKRITDLYVQGTELVLKDDTVMYVQALNPYEMDDARHDAQTARARLVLALKEHGSDETARAKAAFWAEGREAALETLVESHLGLAMLRIVEDIKNDPEWTERLELTERQDEIVARPPTDPERKLLTQINQDYLAEFNGRMETEREFQRKRYGDLGEDELKAEYEKYWVEQRGQAAAMAEYGLCEVWYSARVCDATQREDETWNHALCDHTQKVWETKQEVRALPEALLNAVSEALETLNMSVREAKNSDRQGSSSGSSPLPSEGAASMPSIPDATPAVPPGISPSPSATP